MDRLSSASVNSGAGYPLMEKYLITDTDIPGLLDKWYKRIRESQFSHYQAELQYSAMHYYLGIPTIFLSAMVGSSFFTVSDSNSDGYVRRHHQDTGRILSDVGIEIRNDNCRIQDHVEHHAAKNDNSAHD